MIDWRLNLAALWFVVFMAVTGFQFTFPLMPVFLSRDLGVQPGADLAVWTGAVNAALGLGLFIGSPVWGLVGDTVGRKPMMIRATAVGAVLVGLTGLARGPEDVATLRFLYGTLSAAYPMALALVVMETPREHVAWAVGIMGTSVALATAVGPVLGGIGASMLGPRNVFFVGGAMFAIATIPVLLLVREAHGPRRTVREVWSLDRFRGVPRAAAVVVATILGTQVIMSIVMNGLFTLAVLRLLELAPREPAVVTGIAFGGSGVATALAGVLYSRVVRRAGYRIPASAAAAGLFAVMVGLASAGAVEVFVALVALFGALGGVLTPILSSLLGLESPQEVRATVFGLSSSANALASIVGPFAAGQVAARVGAGPAFIVPAAVAMFLVAVVVLWLPDPPSDHSRLP